jgi:CubicO group peptidase (beta-lactamase class C family)
LDINDPITEYFPYAPTNWSAITISHLLTHTSGIQNYLMETRFHAAAFFTGESNAEAKTFSDD